MYDFGAVQELNAFHNLVNNEPVVDVLKNFLPDGVMQIGLHKLKDKIEILVVLCLDYVMELDYVGVIELV